MASSITIRLDDEATDELERLQSVLGETGKFSSETAAGLRELSDAEQEQIRVVHEHHGSLLQLTTATASFAGSSVSAIGAVAAAWLNFKAQTVWLETFRAGLHSTRAASRLLADNLDLVARQGVSALRFVPRFGAAVGSVIPVVTGATVALSGFRALMARTGQQYVGMAEDWSQATEEQIRAFNELADESQRQGESIERALERAGKSWADFGVRFVADYESNLDRIDAATANLGNSLVRPLRDIAAGAGEVLQQLNPLPAVLREIDATATRNANNLIRNIEALQQLAEYGADAAVGSEGYSERARDLEKLQALREKQQDDFARLRGVNATLDAEQAAAAERRRLEAIDTIAGIDAEIQRQRQRASELANNDRFTAAAAEELHRVLAGLEQRRTSLIDAETKKRIELEQRVVDQQRRWAEETRAREAAQLTEYIDAENAKFQAAQDLARKRAELERGLVHTAQQEAFQSAIARMEAEGASAADVHQAKLRLIQLETQQRIAAAETEEQRQAALFDGERRRLQAEGDFHRRQMQQQAQDRKAKTDAEIAAEKAKHDEIQRLLQQSGAPSGQDLLQQQNPRAVLAALQQRRAAAAAAQFRKDHGDEVDDGDSRSRARFAARERAVRKQAEMQAFRDFKSGDVNPAELANAQVQAGQETLSTLQQSGQLSQQVVQVLSQQLQTAAQEQATLAQLQQQVAQLQRASEDLAGGAQRTRAQTGSLRR